MKLLTMQKHLNHSCDKPLFVVNPRYRSAKWSDSEDYRITMSRKDYKIMVPCGHCFTCRRKRSSSWHYRIYQEALHTRTHRHNGTVVPRILFVTFTFNNESLPETTPLNERNVLAPFIREWRESWRYRFGTSPRYFAVSDLGVRNGRLHLHLLIFDPRYKNGKSISLSHIYVPQKRRKGNKTPNPPSKNLQWKYGWAEASYIRGIAAIHYVSGYMTHANVEKKAKKKRKNPHPKALKHVCSIFVSQGLGKSFIYTNDFATLRCIKASTSRLGKFTYAVPRYYRKYYYDDIPIYTTLSDGRVIISGLITREEQLSSVNCSRMYRLADFFESCRGRPPIKAFGKVYSSQEYNQYNRVVSTYLNKFYDSVYDYIPHRGTLIGENTDFIPRVYRQGNLFS